MKIRDTIKAWVLECQATNDMVWKTKYGDEPRLHPSQFGFCRRKCIWGSLAGFPDHPLYAEPTHPLDDYVLEVMNSGIVWEDVNAPALARLGAAHGVRFDCPPWAFELDFLLPDGTIVEHKDTAEHNFRSKNRLPYGNHCIQLMVYSELMARLGAPASDCILYYHGRGHWAEFKVWQSGSQILWEGEKDGWWTSGVVSFDLRSEMGEVERLWAAQDLPAHQFADPFEMGFGCVKGGSRSGYFPACQYFGHCWPTYPQEGPFDK